MRHQRLIAWVLLAVASAGTVVVPIEAITPAAVAAAADTLPTKICQVDADFCGQDQQLITDGSAAAALTNRDPLVAVGQLLDVALSPASLAVDGYDTQQLVALKNAWPAIMNAGPAVVQAYLESSEIPDGTNGQPDILHKVLGLTEQPRIDIRAIQTLNYVTTPTALNGGGIPWIRVSAIARGYVSEQRKFNRDTADTTTATISPCHEGKCIQVSEIGQLLGTKFTYEVEVPPDKANLPVEEQFKVIDYAKSKVVEREKLPPTNVQVAWQSAAGLAGSPFDPDLTGGSWHSLLGTSGRNQVLEDHIDNGVDCLGSTADGAFTAGVINLTGGSAPSDIGALTRQIGATCLGNEVEGGDLLARFGQGGGLTDNLTDIGADALARLYAASGHSVAPNAFEGSGDQLNGRIGASEFELLSKLVPRGCFVSNLDQTTSRDALVTLAGQCWFAQEYGAWTGERNYFAGLPVNDSAAVARALGASWLHTQITKVSFDELLQVPDRTHPADWLQEKNVLAYERLFGDGAETVAGQLAFAGDAYDQLKAGTLSSAEFLRRIGQSLIDRSKDPAQGGYASMDAAYAASAGKAPAAAANERMQAIFDGRERAFATYGASRIALRVPEPSMEDDLFRYLVSGVVPTDSTGQPTLDFSPGGYFDTKFQLRPGDFAAIVNGQGLAVFQRQGLIASIASLGGQGEALQQNLRPIYTGAFVTDTLKAFKANGEALVEQLKRQLEQFPEQAKQQILGSYVNAFGSYLNGINQSVFDDINRRLAQESATNPFDQLVREAQGPLSQIYSYTYYGPQGQLTQDIRTTLGQLVQIDAQLAAGSRVQLTAPAQFPGGTLGGWQSSVVTDPELIRAYQESVANGTSELGERLLEAGAERVYEQVVAPSLAQTTGPLRQAYQSVQQYVRAVKGAAKALGQLGTGTFNPKLTLDRKGFENFLAYDLIPLAGVSEWTNEIMLAFRLTDPNYALTESDIQGLIYGTTPKVLTAIGAKQADLAYGLAIAVPFIQVLRGKATLEEALRDGMLQTGMQYLWGFTNQIDTGSPTTNRAIQIVIEETMGIAHDSLSSQQAFLGANGRGGTLAALGLIPDDVRLLQTVDPVRYSSTVNELYDRWQRDPLAPEFKDASLKFLDSRGVPPAVYELAAGTTNPATGQPYTVTDVADKYSSSHSLVFAPDNAATLGDKLAKDLCGNNADCLNQNRPLATQLFDQIGKGKDGEAAAQRLARQLNVNAINARVGNADDVLNVRTGRLQSRLVDLGLTALDEQIEGFTGVPNVIRTFLTARDPSEAAIRLGWTALTRYVNFPPELSEVLAYFGGDPINIAKTFSEGRAGAAFAAYAAAQTYKLTKDAGITLALEDLLVAQFGPSPKELEQLHQEATALRESRLELIDRQVDQKSDADYRAQARQLGFGEPTQLQINAARAEEKQLRRSLEPTSEQIGRIKLDGRQKTAVKHFQYALADYGATLSIRSASGNQSVSMNGMTSAMIEGSASDKLIFLTQVLGALNQNELINYLGDAVAAYDIFTYLQNKDKTIETIATGPGDGTGAGDRTVTVEGQKLKVPEAAFAHMDNRLSQLFGWQVPPGFTRAFFAFVSNGFDLKASPGVNVPSMYDILTSQTVQFLIGNWLDKTLGLPIGTSVKLFQLYVQYQLAVQRSITANAAYLAQLTSEAAVAGATIGSELGGGKEAAAAEAAKNAASQLSLIGTVDPQSGAIFMGIDPATGKAATGFTGYDANGLPFAENITGNVGAQATVGGVTYSQQALGLSDEAFKKFIDTRVADFGQFQILTAAANLVINLAFGKTFARLDQSLGLPPGTTATLVSMGVAVGIGSAFGFAPLAALGGPIGIALAVAGLLFSSLFGGKKKKQNAKRKLVRVVYSACGLYPGFEDAAMVGGSSSELVGPAQIAAPAGAGGTVGGLGLPLPPAAGQGNEAAPDRRPKPTELTLTVTGPGLADELKTQPVTVLKPALGAVAQIKSSDLAPKAATSAGPSADAPDATETIEAPEELASQQFLSGPHGLPYCPAPFEANTAEQFRAHLPEVARFGVSTFIGQTLHLTDQLGVSNDPDQTESLRPKRITSYDDGNFFLASLILPRYRDQIDVLYPGFSESVTTDPSSGKPTSSQPKQGIIPNLFTVNYVQVSW